MFKNLLLFAGIICFGIVVMEFIAIAWIFTKLWLVPVLFALIGITCIIASFLTDD